MDQSECSEDPRQLVPRVMSAFNLMASQSKNLKNGFEIGTVATD